MPIKKLRKLKSFIFWENKVFLFVGYMYVSTMGVNVYLECLESLFVALRVLATHTTNTCVYWRATEFDCDCDCGNTSKMSIKIKISFKKLHGVQFQFFAKSLRLKNWEKYK